MSYVNDNLMPNERVLFSARIHPAIFLPFGFSFLLTIALGIYALSLAGQQSPASSTASTFPFLPVVLLFSSGMLFIYSVVLGIEELIVMFTTEFAVTNRRVIAKTGFIRRHTLEMLLSKIESVAVQQSVLGRMLDFGMVTVTGTGGTKESFRSILQPLAVRKKINEIIEQNTQTFNQ